MGGNHMPSRIKLTLFALVSATVVLALLSMSTLHGAVPRW